MHFRGMSSFMMVGEGRKRSLNLSLDFVAQGPAPRRLPHAEPPERHEDPTFLARCCSRTSPGNISPRPRQTSRAWSSTARAGASMRTWNNSTRTSSRSGSAPTKGARWKVPGSPDGRGGLAYLGDDAAAYRRIYEIKTKDDPKSGPTSIRLCKVLTETPPEKLEAALSPMLDIDGALWFLALDNALINNDGYWIRTSDYGIYQEVNGRFHIIPQDVNETFSQPGGPGFGGGPGGPGGFGGGGGSVRAAARALCRRPRAADAHRVGPAWAVERRSPV